VSRLAAGEDGGEYSSGSAEGFEPGQEEWITTPGSRTEIEQTLDTPSTTSSPRSRRRPPRAAQDAAPTAYTEWAASPVTRTTISKLLSRRSDINRSPRRAEAVAITSPMQRMIAKY
jgi:RNA polymerase sigma-54 factor